MGNKQSAKIFFDGSQIEGATFQRTDNISDANLKETGHSVPYVFR